MDFFGICDCDQFLQDVLCIKAFIHILLLNQTQQSVSVSGCRMSNFLCLTGGSPSVCHVKMKCEASAFGFNTS